MTHLSGLSFFSASMMFHLKHINAEHHLRVEKGWGWYPGLYSPLLLLQPATKKRKNSLCASGTTKGARAMIIIFSHATIY